LKLFLADEDEVPNLDREGSREDSLAEENRLEVKLLGLLNKLADLGASVVVVVFAVLKLNLDLVLVFLLVLGLGLDVVVVNAAGEFNLARDLDLVRSLVALVVVSGTSDGACLLKPALCLEEDWAELVTELLSLTAALGLSSLGRLSFHIIKRSERSPAKDRSFTTEEGLYPLPGSFSFVSSRLGNYNGVQIGGILAFGNTSVRSDNLPMGGNKDGSIASRKRWEVRDGDGGLLSLGSRCGGSHPVGISAAGFLPDVGESLLLPLLQAGTEGVGYADAPRGDDD
jgi:hypothetical protein